MNRAPRSVLALAMASACVLPGCRGWVVQPGPARAAIEGYREEVVRVVRLDGTKVIVYSPRLIADSLVGFTKYPPAWESEPVVVPVSEARSVAFRRVNGTSTLIGLAITVSIIHLLASSIDLGGGCNITVCIP